MLLLLLLLLGLTGGRAFSFLCSTSGCTIRDSTFVVIASTSVGVVRGALGGFGGLGSSSWRRSHRVGCLFVDGITFSVPSVSPLSNCWRDGRLF